MIGRVEGGEVDLMDIRVHPGHRLEDHPPLVARGELGGAPRHLGVPLPEGDRDTPPERLVDLVRGDEGPGREPGGEVRGEAREPGRHEHAGEPPFAVHEGPLGVDEDPPLGDEGRVLVVHPPVTPVGLPCEGPEPPAPAEGLLNAELPRPAHDPRDPDIGAGHQDHVGVDIPDEGEEVVEQDLLGPLEHLPPPFAPHLDAGQGAVAVGVPQDLHLRHGKGHGEVEGEPRLARVTAGDEAGLGHGPLVEPDVHVVEVCGAVRLPLNPFGDLSPRRDPVPVERAVDRGEPAFLHRVDCPQVPRGGPGVRGGRGGGGGRTGWRGGPGSPPPGSPRCGPGSGRTSQGSTSPASSSFRISMSTEKTAASRGSSKA